MKTIHRFRTDNVLFTLLSLLLLALANPSAVHATPGHLDGFFGNGGRAITTFGTIDDEANSVVVQTDGKIVAAGFSNNGTKFVFAVARYNKDGKLDTTFNATGMVTTDFGGTGAQANSVALQPDGKIVVAGQTSFGAGQAFALARYNPDGTLDTTFNGSGLVTTDVFNGHSIAYGVAVRTDGKIVAAGYSAGPNNVFALARYNSDGSLDTGFNTTGKVTTDFVPLANRNNMAYGVAVQTDGRILAAGWVDSGTKSNFALARYNEDGSLDTNFNTTGLVTTDIGGGTVSDIARSLAVQTDGKIVLAGQSGAGNAAAFALARYNPDGSPDTGFNTTGKVITSIGSNGAAAYGVAVQPDGKIVAAGSSTIGNKTGFGMLRYHADGSLDTHFNTTQTATTAITLGYDAAAAVALQADGEILLAGQANKGSATEFAVVRFQVGPAGRDIDGDGLPDLVFQNNVGSIYAWYMNGAGTYHSHGFLFRGSLADWKIKAIADLNGDGIADVVFQNDLGQIFVWYLDGSGNISSSGFLCTSALADWKIVAIADMDGDGKADVVFQNTAGQTYIWYLNGAGVISSHGYLFGGGLADWKVVGIADLDGDGKADVIFQNTVGQIYVWHMNGAGAIASHGFLYGGGLGDWRVMCVTDMDGDGIPDIIFQNTVGQVFVWYLNGSSGISLGTFLYSGGLSDWRVR